MTSIFKSDKRDEALERLAIGIIEGAKNCTTVIKKINSLSQKPNNYTNTSEIINDWSEYLFTNHFHDFIDEWILPSTISVENEEHLANAFFNYFASLTPFFYEHKTIISPEINKLKKYKWTTEDYKELKIKLLHKWFYSEWDNWDGETKLKLGYKLEMNTKKVVKSIAASSKANSSIWNREKKIDTIVFSNDLQTVINKIMPSHQHQYQVDLFLKYSNDFIGTLPAAFKKFDDNFYEVGTYLYKNFQWSNKL